MILTKEPSRGGNGYCCLVKCDVCGKNETRKAHWAERYKHHFCSLNVGKRTLLILVGGEGESVERRMVIFK